MQGLPILRRDNTSGSATPDIKVASFDGDSIFAAGYQADNYIQLDGVNDYIDLPTLGSY